MPKLKTSVMMYNMNTVLLLLIIICVTSSHYDRKAVMSQRNVCPADSGDTSRQMDSAVNVHITIGQCVLDCVHIFNPVLWAECILDHVHWAPCILTCVLTCACLQPIEMCVYWTTRIGGV